MPSFRVLGIALFMAIVRTAPVTDGISSDGITPFIGDQLDSELNFQPLPKIISLDPTNAEPESDTGTKSGPKTPTITPKPVTTAANSELNPHRGNATSTKLPEITSADPDPPRDYFRENDFQCPKEADFIGCCDGGSFDKCETFSAQKPACKKSKNMTCCHQILDSVLLSKTSAYKCDSKAIQLSGPLLY